MQMPIQFPTRERMQHFAPIAGGTHAGEKKYLVQMKNCMIITTIRKNILTLPIIRIIKMCYQKCGKNLKQPEKEQNLD